MPEFDTLVQDIYGLFETENGSLDLGKLLEEHSSEVSELLSRRLSEVGKERPGTLRMSNIGRPDRQLWYDVNYKGATEPLLASTQIKFMYGDLIEQMMLFLAQVAGHDVQLQQKEVDVEGVQGHIDCVIDGVVTDVKSASTFSFKKFETGSLLEPGMDPFGYVGQLAGYVEGIDPRADGAFLAVDKTLGKLCTLRISNTDLQQYKVKDRIIHVKGMVKSETPPERCYEPKPEGKSGNLVLDTGCSYCRHKFHCWSDVNGGEGLLAYSYSSGPKFFVHVEKEPRVSQIGIEEF